MFEINKEAFLELWANINGGSLDIKPDIQDSRDMKKDIVTSMCQATGKPVGVKNSSLGGGSTMCNLLTVIPIATLENRTVELKFELPDGVSNAGRVVLSVDKAIELLNNLMIELEKLK